LAGSGQLETAAAVETLHNRGVKIHLGESQEHTITKWVVVQFRSMRGMSVGMVSIYDGILLLGLATICYDVAKVAIGSMARCAELTGPGTGKPNSGDRP